jgi:hypothetical protein
MSFRWMAWLPSTVARARRSLLVSAGVGVSIATLACGTLPAEGTAGSSTGGEAQPPSDSGAVTCPSPNPPNELMLTAGTPQTAMLGSAFATNLQVAFTNSNGCPVTTAVAGIPVTFSAPTVGASGSFSASGSNTVTVGSDASGMTAAPMFIANYAAGGYTVTASSTYGSLTFSLTNVEGSDSSDCGAVANTTTPSTDESPAGIAGRPTKLTVGIGATQSTPAGTRFPIRLAVTVTDAEKHPVPGVLVTFAAPDRGPSGYFTVPAGGAHVPVPLALPSARSGSYGPRPHRTHRRRAEVRTDTCGIALAPALTANHHAGGYIVVASVEHVKAAFALVNEGQ